MQLRRSPMLRATAVAVILTVVIGCAPEYRPWFLGGTLGQTSVAGSVFSADSGRAFTEVLIQGQTFIEGSVVTTVTHQVGDLFRRPILIDFNHDGKVDPVVGYRQEQRGVIQILVSYGNVGTVQFASLTLDGGENAWAELADVGVADIDGDGNLDLIAATRDGVVYLHHPDDADQTHALNGWGAATGAEELISGTTDTITNDELLAIIAQAVGVGVNLDNYLITVEQGYTSVEIADFDRDGYNDVAASRSLRISLEPKSQVSLPPVYIFAGSLQLLVNPGGATTGAGWTAVPLGTHERHNTPDREGARDLRACDLNGDGYLDLISTATDDQNVQVAWFEHPGIVAASSPWSQHRIGSVRGAYTIDVADVTGDGLVDVVATSPTQMQLVLFVQPSDVQNRGFDWYTVPIVDFESFEPRSVKALDVNGDETYELVVGGTAGAVRYFSPPVLLTDQWIAHDIVTLDPPGDVGLLGYGDLDADGDVDIVTVVTGDDADRVVWIRNDLFQW